MRADPHQPAQPGQHTGDAGLDTLYEYLLIFSKKNVTKNSKGGNTLMLKSYSCITLRSTAVILKFSTILIVKISMVLNLNYVVLVGSFGL